MDCQNFTCSGSRQDFREFTVRLETLDEFRYLKLSFDKQDTLQRLRVTSTSTPNNNSSIPPTIAGASQIGAFFLRLRRILGATPDLEIDGLERVMMIDDLSLIHI